MSLEENKTIVSRLFVEVNDASRYEVMTEICAPDIRIHDPLMGELTGTEAFKGVLSFFAQSFSAQKKDLHVLIAEGDFVAVLHTHTGVHTGIFNGVPPTGTKINVPGCELFRLKNGKITEFWRMDADLSLLMQIGAIPVPSRA
jgi:predicted ester cyclase